MPLRPVATLIVVLLVLPANAQAQEGFDMAVDGFGFAVNVAFAPDGTMFVADKDRGEIRVVRDGELLPEPFATVDADSPVNEMGLLGVVVHPSFPAEPWVFAYYSDVNDRRNHLVRFRADGYVASEREDLLDLLPTTAGWHNGGDLAFGPDGALYVSVGEGHDAARAQEPNGLGGRILRLNPDGSVPADNPFGPDDPTFALGIRNSFGLCFDPATGELWETENGPDRWGEINLIEAGGNYGWPEHLGPGGPSTFVEPVLAFEEQIVVTGCAGTPSDAGLYFGEGYTGNLHRMQIPSGAADPTPHDEIVTTFDGGITDVAATPDGTIWVVTPNAIYRSTQILLPAPGQTSSGSATGGTAAGAETGATGAPASPSPAATTGRFGGAGLIVLGLLIGGFLLLRTRLLRRQR
ncbi:MAG: PQQ-dependent sugar dehydrogenase [Actinobacteria bacterium]|nr:PQQ-dependent sugar dehydrogenase [Actinomycetota bacterium]